MNKKFYNFETRFRTLKDELRSFLKDNGIYYELSECFGGWHFEIKLSSDEVEIVNNFLDSITITEEK